LLKYSEDNPSEHDYAFPVYRADRGLVFIRGLLENT
jgi:hypothetical protein